MLWSALMLLLLLACADPIYGEPLNETGEGSAAIEDPTHDVDIQPLWEAHCAGCHTGGGTNGDLALDDGHGATVGVASSQLGTMNLIEPNDPDNSYLYLKLVGTHVDAGGSGGAMPPGDTLDDDVLQTIQNWIDDGAPQ